MKTIEQLLTEMTALAESAIYSYSIAEKIEQVQKLGALKYQIEKLTEKP